MKRIMAWILGFALVLGGLAAWAEGEGFDFEQIAGLEWTFSSGAGGWSTDMRIEADGAFSGEFHDSEMGELSEEYPNGTLYVCAFTGQMSVVEQVNENTWKLRVDRLVYDGEPGEEAVDDGIRFVTTEPYGISEGDEMLLFLPGTPVDVLTEDMRMWTHLLDPEQAPTKLEDWFLYSEENESGFVGYALDEEAEIVNPWVELTPAELRQVSGLSFGVPEGAEDVVYRWLESEGLAEMQFTMFGDEFCARVQPAELEDGELMNISGMYFDWEYEEDVTVGQCHGTIGQAQTGSEDWVELCLWYDAEAGLMRSLSVYTTELDGLDLTALAEMVGA